MQMNTKIEQNTIQKPCSNIAVASIFVTNFQLFLDCLFVFWEFSLAFDLELETNLKIHKFSTGTCFVTRNYGLVLMDSIQRINKTRVNKRKKNMWCHSTINFFRWFRLPCAQLNRNRFSKKAALAIFDGC